MHVPVYPTQGDSKVTTHSADRRVTFVSRMMAGIAYEALGDIRISREEFMEKFSWQYEILAQKLLDYTDELLLWNDPTARRVVVDALQRASVSARQDAPR